MAAETVSHFIGGRPAHSTLRKTYGVADPATGTEYAQVEVGMAADVNQAALAAAAALAQSPWPKLPAGERAAVLGRIADAIDARAAEVAAAEAVGPGLPVTQARAQATRAAAVFRDAAGQLGARPAGASAGSAITRPAGIAGLITSWRSPFLAQARAVAPALAAGCAIVLKPDEWAPRPAALLTEIVTAAGLPDGVLNVVHGSLHRKAPGAQARDALIAHPRIARLSFDGDAATGRQIMIDAATHGTPLATALAGQSVGLIFADADLEAAVDGAVFGAFALGGQRRTATSTLLVAAPAYDAVVSWLAERAGRIRVGDPADPATELGPLPDAGLVDELASWVRLGVREGARLAAGGRPPSGLAAGNYVAPTVLADLDRSMKALTEVIRGPALRVARFDADDEAVALANAVADPTAAYLWTADLDRARSLAADLAAPGVWVNAANVADDLAADTGGIGFYTQATTVRVAADDEPVPRFGA